LARELNEPKKKIDRI